MRPKLRTLLALTLLTPLTALAAAPIIGTVTNKTNNKPSAGDDVVLIRLAQGMQESTRTKTDAKGHFTLSVPDEGIHLVRVTHDKANYFRPAPPGTQSVEVEVFNSAPKVKGVSSEADVMRIQTDAGGKTLKIVENFFLKNESTPPMTQFSERPFEFTLPEGAIIEGSAALGPGGMPVQSPPVPLAEKGHYTFIFPIRPGETRFQISYNLPYTGKVTLSPQALMATDTFVVILAKNMNFDSAAQFAPINDETESKTSILRNVAAGQIVSFTLSGTGQLPRPTDANGQPNGPATGEPQGAAAGSGGPEAGGDAASDKRPGGGLGNPIDTPDPLSKYKWWIIAGIGLLLAAAAGFLLSRPKDAVPVAGTPQNPAPLPTSTAPSSTTSPTLMTVLRDELFTLESERLSGHLPAEEYIEVKTALETILKHALKRQS